jgi:hypothetical protein
MKKFRPIAARFWPIAAIIGTAALTLCLAYVFSACPDDFDWPAWVQAVGSISAILAAIWVNHDQGRQQQLRDAVREKAEVVGTLRSLLAEVQTTLIYLDNQMGPTLQAKKAGHPIRSVFSLPEYPFPVFEGLIPKLGAIPDGELLKEIFHSYGYARSLAITATVHDKMVQTLEDTEAQARINSAAASNVPRIGAILENYGNSLIKSYAIAHPRMELLAQKLDAAILQASE